MVVVLGSKGATRPASAGQTAEIPYPGGMEFRDPQRNDLKDLCARGEEPS